MKSSSNLTIPKHVAFIMDGNGRWARRRKRPRVFGHMRGVDHLRNVMEWCADLDIRVITAYVFSTENWNRPKAEVDALMEVIRKRGPYLARELHEQGMQIRHLGSRERVPADVLEVIDDSVELTRDNKDYFANIAYNYGGRREIVDATKRIINAKLKPEEVTEEVVSRYMYSGGDLPDPDLLIRTGGESRLSNFLLWQTTNCIFHVTPVLWPDFGKDDLLKAIELFNQVQSKSESF